MQYSMPHTAFGMFKEWALLMTKMLVPPHRYFEIGDPIIYFHLMSNGLITIFIISSTWLIVVMAAERYIAVCHPLQARKLISLRRTRTSIVLVFVICTVATIPIFLEMTIQDACADGRVVRELRERDKEAAKPLQRLVWSIFFDFIPCAALIYFNLCLIIQIRKAKKLREQMTPKHSLIRYSSPNSKDNHLKHSTVPAGELNGKKGAGLLPQRAKGRKGLLDSNVAPDDAKQIEMTNGASKCLKFVANRPKDSRSQENDSLGNESTQNELRGLNDIPKPTRSFHSPSSNKLRTESTIRKRPSDNALNSVTATLVAVILLFLILVSPSELLKFSVEHTSADESQKKIVTSVTNFMQVLNFSLNFVLYCAVNKTFRHTLYGLVCCCWLTLSRSFCGAISISTLYPRVQLQWRETCVTGVTGLELGISTTSSKFTTKRNPRKHNAMGIMSSYRLRGGAGRIKWGYGKSQAGLREKSDWEGGGQVGREESVGVGKSQVGVGKSQGGVREESGGEEGGKTRVGRREGRVKWGLGRVRWGARRVRWGGKSKVDAGRVRRMREESGGEEGGKSQVGVWKSQVGCGKSQVGREESGGEEGGKSQVGVGKSQVGREESGGEKEGRVKWG
ncbi:hypothetical protein Btru_077826 [Bulinus truncatus]|nr:hypothetical protein Btru_077826 [Bulinus truncatus]